MNISSLWTDTGSTLEKVVLAIAIGFVIASLIMLFHKRVIGRLVRELIKRGANTPETALTASELGFKPTSPAIRALKNPAGGLRTLISVVPDGSDGPSDGALKNDALSTARFYAPEEKRIRAEVRYDAKNTTIPIVIIGAIAFGIAAYLCIRYIPQLLELKLFD